MMPLRRLLSAIDIGDWGTEPETDDAAIRCIRAADFDFVRLKANVGSAPLRLIREDVKRRSLLRRGDLVLEKSGGGAKTPVGRAVLFDSDQEAVCSNFSARLRPAHGVDSRYLSFLLAALYYSGATERCAIQTTGIQNLDTGAWLQTEVPEIATLEQRRIADFLDDQVARIDNIIAARERQVRLLETQLSMSADYVLSRDDWGKSTRLGRFIDRIEQGWSPQCEVVPAADGEWGVLKVSAIRAGRFIELENKRLPDDLEPTEGYEVRAGDLLVTRANTPALVGLFAVAPANVRSKLILSDKIMRVSLRRGFTADFVALVGQARSTRDRLSGAGTGTSQSMVNIRGADIRDLPVPVLDEELQMVRVAEHRKLAARLASGRLRLESEVDLLNELKRSLITAAVSGEFDVSSADGSQIPVGSTPDVPAGTSAQPAEVAV